MTGTSNTRMLPVRGRFLLGVEFALALRDLTGTNPNRLGIAFVRSPERSESELPLRLLRSLFGRKERQVTTASDLGLKLARFDAMTAAATVECGDYGRINECQSLGSHSLPAGPRLAYEARRSCMRAKTIGHRTERCRQAKTTCMNQDLDATTDLVGDSATSSLPVAGDTFRLLLGKAGRGLALQPQRQLGVDMAAGAAALARETHGAQQCFRHTAHEVGLGRRKATSGGDSCGVRQLSDSW